MGRPEEIASAVIWLCSDAASFVVGFAPCNVLAGHKPPEFLPKVRAIAYPQAIR